jgi:hypothetical protein
MQMGAEFHNRPRCKLNHSQQQVLLGCGENLHAPKNGMLPALRFIDKIGTDSGQTLWKFKRKLRFGRGLRRFIAR